MIGNGRSSPISVKPLRCVVSHSNLSLSSMLTDVDDGGHYLLASSLSSEKSRSPALYPSDNLNLRACSSAPTQDRDLTCQYGGDSNFSNDPFSHKPLSLRLSTPNLRSSSAPSFDAREMSSALAQNPLTLMNPSEKGPGSPPRTEAFRAESSRPSLTINSRSGLRLVRQNVEIVGGSVGPMTAPVKTGPVFSFPNPMESAGNYSQAGGLVNNGPLSADNSSSESVLSRLLANVPSRVLILENVPPELSLVSLVRAMESCGDVRAVLSMENRITSQVRIGVLFYHLDHAIHAYRTVRDTGLETGAQHSHGGQRMSALFGDSSTLLDDKVSIRVAYSASASTSSDDFSNQGSLLVIGLPPNSDKDALNEIFSQYGPVRWIQYSDYIQGGLIVEFLDLRDAEKAKFSLHGKPCFNAILELIYYDPMSKSYASNNGSERQSPPTLRGQPDRSSSFPPMGELDISRYERINDDEARLIQQQQMARLRLNQTLRVSHMKRMPNLTIDTTNPSQRAGGAATSRPAFKSSQLRPIGQSPVSAPGNFFAGYNFPTGSPAKTSQDVSAIFASINPYSQSMVGHPLSAAPVENPVELPSSPWKNVVNPIPAPGAPSTSPGDSPPLSSSLNGKTRLGSVGKHEGSPSLSNTGAIGSEMRKRNSSFGYMEADVPTNSIEQWSGVDVSSSTTRLNLSAASQGPPPGLDSFSARVSGAAQMNAYANAAMQSQYDMQASYEMQNQYDMQAARLLESMTAQVNPYMVSQTSRFPGAHNYEYNGRSAEYSDAGVMHSKVLRNRGGGRGRDDGNGQYVPRQSSAGRSNDINPYNIMMGHDTRTTFMIRNIPNKFTQHMLIEFINESHYGEYDFLYLRMDFVNQCNVGYSFINFIDPKSVISFAERVVGKKWGAFNSEKVCMLSYANIQGKQALIKKFRNSSVMYEDPAYRPKIYFSLGPYRGQEEPFPDPDPTQVRPRSNILFSRENAWMPKSLTKSRTSTADGSDIQGYEQSGYDSVLSTSPVGADRSPEMRGRKGANVYEVRSAGSSAGGPSRRASYYSSQDELSADGDGRPYSAGGGQSSQHHRRRGREDLPYMSTTQTVAEVEENEDADATFRVPEEDAEVGPVEVARVLGEVQIGGKPKSAASRTGVPASTVPKEFVKAKPQIGSKNGRANRYSDEDDTETMISEVYS